MMKCRDTLGFCITAAFHTDSAPELSGRLLEQQCLCLAAPMHQSVQYPARVKCGGKAEHHVSLEQTVQTGTHRHYCRDIMSLLGCWKPFWLRMTSPSTLRSCWTLKFYLPSLYWGGGWNMKAYISKSGQIQAKLSTWLDTTWGTVSFLLSCHFLPLSGRWRGQLSWPRSGKCWPEPAPPPPSGPSPLRRHRPAHPGSDRKMMHKKRQSRKIIRSV